MTATLRAPALPPRPRRAPRLSVHPSVALGLVAAGAVGVIALWWHDTASVNGLGDWLTNAGRITGLLAGYAVVVLLALMARAPAVERGVGADRLARWHAMGGRYTVSLSVAHTLLIIWGYSVTAHTNVVNQTSTLILTYPDVLMATVALGLLVAVGVASARAARKRLSYETWHFIHLYTYLAIALTFSHQFATGADFSADATARWLWSILYLSVALILIWYRLVTPVAAYFHHQMRVAEVRSEGPGVVSVFITGHDLTLLQTESGQFFRWRFLTRDLWWAANPYSLSAPPRSDFLRITVKIAGSHSAALAHVRPGTKVFAEGPYGAFTEYRRRQRKVLLIGGGVGITPLRALFETIPGGPGELALLYRAERAEDLVLRGELEAIARDRSATVQYLLGPVRTGLADPLSSASLRRLVPDIADRDVFLCGPEAMMTSVHAALRRAGVGRGHIHHESFRF